MPTEKKIDFLLAFFLGLLVLSLWVPHRPIFPGSLTGHALAVTGTLFISLTLIYPFRKRILGKKGRENPLSTHIYYGLIGPSLVMIHSTHKAGSLVGILIFLTTLLVVLSGITGRFLLIRIYRALKGGDRNLIMLRERFDRFRSDLTVNDKKFVASGSGHWERGQPLIAGKKENRLRDDKIRALMETAHSIAELEYSQATLSRTQTLFSYWNKAHISLTMLLFALIIIHILNGLYYGLRWLS